MTRTGWKIVAGIGGVLTFGPILGLVVTVVGLLLAFRATESGDPATKAERLAQGISMAMNATAIGLVVAPIGAVLFGVSLYKLLKKPPAAAA